MGLADYENFKDEFNEKHSVIIKRNIEKTNPEIRKEIYAQINIIKKELCLEECNLISNKDLDRNTRESLKLEKESYVGFIIIAENDDAIKNIIHYISDKPIWGKLGKNLHLMGIPYTNYLLNNYSKQINKVIFPALFVFILLFLIFYFRSLKSAIGIFIPALFGTALSLSSIKVLYGHSNLINSIVPLLIFVINLSLCLHLYFTLGVKGCIKETIRSKLGPIFLMIITTCTGFLSLLFSDLFAIRQFGLLAGILILITSLSSLLWVYLFSNNIGFHHQSSRIIFLEKLNTLFEPFFQRFSTKKELFILASISLILGSYSFNSINTVTDATTYFPEELGVKKSISEISDSISGIPLLSIVLYIDEEQNISEYQKIVEIEEKLEIAIIKSNPSLQLFSNNKLVRLVNKKYTGKDKIPDQPLSYYTLRQQLPSFITDSYPVGEKYIINISGAPMDVDTFTPLVKKIRSIIDKSGRPHELQGLHYHLMVAQEKMIMTLFTSFGLSLLVISFIAFLAFKKIKLFFIFLFVNIIPVLLTFIFMKVLNLSFNIATVMTFSISLGLIVDSSFHIIHCLNYTQSRRYYYQTIVRPVVGASTLLGICFFFFGMSDFLPIREFGVCLGIILMIGMYFDLRVLPSLYLNQTELTEE